MEIINRTKLGLNNISVGTTDYTDGDPNKTSVKKHGPVKSEAHKALTCG